MIELIKKIVPDNFKKKYHARKQAKLKEKIASLPKVDETEFKRILKEDLSIVKGDLVMIHSSIDRINLDFSFLKTLDLILEVVGENGTIMFPSFPKKNSFNFLNDGEIFKQKRTPSYMGILSELARRHSKSFRSLHPTKSVVAIGPLAEELTSEHHLSKLPYDEKSPFYKLYEKGGKAIGLGVKTTFFSAIHVIDDIVPEKLPFNPYHEKLFSAICIDNNKNEVIVDSYAHDMSKMHFDLPKFFAKNVPHELGGNLNINGSDYFKADVKPLFDHLFKLANQGITIYKY